MGMFMAFVIGWLVGARTGKKEFDDLTRSLRALGRSDEFGEVVAAARSHVSHTLRELAVVVDGMETSGKDGQLVDGDQDLVARVKTLFGRE